ncbi:hypothetical protein [Micromonospora sp. NPDC092111]|uniref:Cap15 family cyclic dinucleotide receptor domain-containing protein n=1 Tax=Micromonospora sp. NPDC092111 TaxID=3364289 RepID=UPI0038297062
MPNSAWTRGLIFLAAGIWFGLAFILGMPLNETWLRLVGGVASIVVLLLLAFDLFAWRWFPAWLVKRPNIRGTWKATFRSSWTDADGKPVEGDCYIVVHQSYSKLCIEVYFAISDSVSTSANILQGEGRSTLWFTYRSEGHALEQEGNPPHRGAMMLYISLQGRPGLAGDYWTERKTKGRIETSGRSKKLAGSFQAAKELKYV